MSVCLVGAANHATPTEDLCVPLGYWLCLAAGQLDINCTVSYLSEIQKWQQCSNSGSSFPPHSLKVILDKMLMQWKMIVAQGFLVMFLFFLSSYSNKTQVRKKIKLSSWQLFSFLSPNLHSSTSLQAAEERKDSMMCFMLGRMVGTQWCDSKAERTC